MFKEVYIVTSYAWSFTILGKPALSKTDEFLEKVLVISDLKKFICQKYLKNCNIFSEKGAGGSKAVWKFSENSSVLVTLGFH